MLFDSHTHLNDSEYTKEEFEALVSEIEASQISCICDVGFDVESSRLAVEHAVKYPWCYAAVGIHPHDTYKTTEEDFEEIRKLALRGLDPADPAYKKIVAIGEIGLDYHYDKEWEAEQIYWFKRQIALAKDLKLPIMIHSRDADQITFDILKSEGAFEVPVDIHCYSGHLEMAKEYVKLGAYLGVDGPITYKNNKKGVEVFENVPLEHILLETDAPYLTPVPFRGQRNKSPYVEYVAKKVAEIRGLTYEEVARATTENAKRYFGI